MNEHFLGRARLETKAQWQRHGLTEVSDDCVPAPGQTTCNKVKDKVAFDLALNTGTVDVMLHQAATEALSGTIGVSGMYQTSASTGPIFLVPGATANAAGAFAFEQVDLGMLTVVAGTRADHKSLSSDAQPEIQRAADARSWNATTANVGLSLRPISHLAFTTNYAAGWRAPTLFDLYANGPNLAEGRFEIGDPALRSERSHNVEGGIRWLSDRVNADIAVFYNSVDDFIFTTPTASTQNGLAVFRHTQADAMISGADAELSWRPTSVLTLRGEYDFVRGSDRVNSTPLPLMPPPRSIVGADAALGTMAGFRNTSVGAEVEVDQKQTRLSPFDFPTDGYSLLNMRASSYRSVRSREVHLDLHVRNALNTTYRDYLSRFNRFANAPGINVTLKASAGAW